MSTIRCAVVLLQLNDAPQPPPLSGSYFQDLFTRDPQSLSQYWADASLGQVDLTECQVFDWQAIWLDSLTYDRERQRALEDPERGQDDWFYGLADQHPGFRNVVNSASFHQIPFDLVWVIIHGNGPISSLTGAGSDYQTDLILYTGPTARPSQPTYLAPVDMASIPNSFGLAYMARQIGYYLHLPLSRDNSEYEHEAFRSSHGALYDAYDLMSSSRITHRFQHPRFGMAGPMLCAPQLYGKHWIPDQFIRSLPNEASFTTDIYLTSLSWYSTVGRQQPPAPDSPLLMINIGNRFSIELRSRQGWDAGIPTNQTILIHQLLYNPANPSYLQPILMKSAGDGFNGSVQHEWGVNQWWDSRLAGNSAFSETNPELVGYTLVSVLRYEPEHNGALIRIIHHAPPQWPIYVMPDRLYRYKGCLVMLDGRLSEFALKDEMTPVVRQLLAIDTASRLEDGASVKFQLAQWQQLSQLAQVHSEQLQKQLQAGPAKANRQEELNTLTASTLEADVSIPSGSQP
jgi:hypothetical protein